MTETNKDSVPAKQEDDDIRDALGRMRPGKTLNPAGGGRIALPHWYKDHGPDALLGILAEATGIALRMPWMTDEQWAVLEDAAKHAKPEHRSMARKQMKEDIYGKAPQSLEMSGNVTISPLAAELTRIAEAFTADKPESVDSSSASER